MNKKLKKTGRPPVKRNTSQVEEATPALWIKHLGKSLLFSLAIGLGLILVCSLVAYFCADPDQLILPLSLIASALTALASGFITVRIHGHSALMCGLLGGSLLMSVMMLASLFFRGQASGYSATVSCLLHAGFVLLSVAGAFLGLKKEKRKPKRR